MLTVAVGLQKAIDSVSKDNVKYVLSHISTDVIFDAIEASLEPATLWQIPGPSIQDIYRLLFRPAGLVDMGPYVRYYFPRPTKPAGGKRPIHTRSCLLKRDEVTLCTDDLDPNGDLPGLDTCEYMDFVKGSYGRHKVLVKRFKNCGEEVIDAEISIRVLLGPHGVTPQLVGVLQAGRDTFDSPAIVLCHRPWQPLERFLGMGRVRDNKILLVQMAFAVVNTIHKIHQQKIVLNDLHASQLGLTYREGGLLTERSFRAVVMDVAAATETHGQRMRIPEGQSKCFEHIAPEVKAGEPGSFASDIFSLGKILEVITKAGDVSELQRLVKWCALEDPKQRPYARVLLKHLDEVYIAFLYAGGEMTRRPPMPRKPPVPRRHHRVANEACLPRTPFDKIKWVARQPSPCCH